MPPATIDEPVYLGFHTPSDIERLRHYRTQWEDSEEPVELHRVHGPVSRINLYVGANNSGKSRLLRALLHAQPSAGLLASARTLRTQAIVDLRDLGECHAPSTFLPVSLLHPRATGFYHYLVVPWVDWAREELERWPLYTLLERVTLNRDAQIPGTGVSPYVGPCWPRSLHFKLWGSIVLVSHQAIADADRDPIASLDLTERWKNIEAFTGILDKRVAVTHAPRVYIPVLRSAHTLHGCGHERDPAGDIFLTTVVENYGIDLSDDEPRLEVFTGLQLYDQILRDRCGPKRMRERIDAFERFLSQQFFGGQSVEIVPRYTRDRAEQHIFVNIGEHEERELHNLGDGINALILVLYKLFTADQGAWIFIEEPEINLHPGLQRIFLQTLLHDPWVRALDLRIFLTTHSNHLVGMAMHHPGEISVFAVSPEPTETSTFLVRTVQGPELGLLDELGVDNASVFLANCSLWVEGPSDRIYVRALLAAHARAKGSQLREDLDFAFFEFGGSNFKHYAFGAGHGDPAKIRAQFVANRVFLLADHDDDPTKYARLHEAAGAGGPFEFVTTEPAREIENLLSITALKAIFRHQREVIDRTLRTIDPESLPWHTITPEALLSHKFSPLFEQLLAATPAAPSKFANKKTALADAFARAVEAGQVGWDDLGAPAQELTLRIAGFIARHSPGRSSGS